MATDMAAIMLAVFIAGALGGVVNALLTDNGFMMPRNEIVDESKHIFRPGYLGNILIGAVAALVSWGLYSPYGAMQVIGGPPAMPGQVTPGLTVFGLMGAILVGIGGARWLTSEVDKSLLKAAASRAADSQPSSSASSQIAAASPAGALQIAKAMPMK